MSLEAKIAERAATPDEEVVGFLEAVRRACHGRRRHNSRERAGPLDATCQGNGNDGFKSETPFRE